MAKDAKKVSKNQEACQKKANKIEVAKKVNKIFKVVKKGTQRIWQNLWCAEFGAVPSDLGAAMLQVQCVSMGGCLVQWMEIFHTKPGLTYNELK